MTRTLPLLLFAVAFASSGLVGSASNAQAQGRYGLPDFLFDPSYYSSRIYEKNAVMDGNEVALTFFNYGLLGGIGEIRGNWPQGEDNSYIGDVVPVIAVEVPVDTNNDGVADSLIRNTVTTRSPRAGADGPPGNPNIFWGFEAKPGFASNQFVNDEGTTEENERAALSTTPETWPSFWPDQPTWIDPATGGADWNGFFGRDQFQADLETYFWADDQNDDEITEGIRFPIVPGRFAPARARRYGPRNESAWASVEPVPRRGRHLLALRDHQHEHHHLPPRRRRPHRRQLRRGDPWR